MGYGPFFMTAFQHFQRIQAHKEDLIKEINFLVSEHQALHTATLSQPYQFEIGIGTNERALDVEGYATMNGLYMEDRSVLVQVLGGYNEDADALPLAILRDDTEQEQTDDDLLVDNGVQGKYLDAFDLLELAELYDYLEGIFRTDCVPTAAVVHE